jgi:hypothetical protein
MLATHTPVENRAAPRSPPLRRLSAARRRTEAAPRPPGAASAASLSTALSQSRDMSRHMRVTAPNPRAIRASIWIAPSRLDRTTPS